MSFDRPTLSTLIERSRGDLASRMPGADPALRHSLLDILLRIHAGTAAGLYGYLDFLALQLMPDTAEGAYLERWASIWGLRRKSAIAAAGTAVATGIDGSTIAAGTEARSVGGSTYRTLEEATIAAGTTTVSIEATESGPDHDLVPGAVLTLSSAVPGVNAPITVATSDRAGAIEESDPALLARLLARVRKVPQGGAEEDYVAWALAQSGVTRAWCFPGWMGAGTVGVTFVLDDRANIVPLQADLDAVEAALEELRPVTAELVVFAPTTRTIDIELKIAPDTAAVRAAIEEELADFFARDAEPGGTIYASRIGEAVSLAEGEFRHSLELPDKDVTSDPGELPILGNVSFVA
ncbi:MAG: hypothetical protein COW16_10350 [Sphingomonadales bacterium CG12_big_fil_rev_8_21_14_0_65_65_10]|nr:MAG: hypothetical protein COW16_10350 [Sphingomonadales bacterium CG12_big_fil_rev_8_21_14_0_65_65_10]